MNIFRACFFKIRALVFSLEKRAGETFPLPPFSYAPSVGDIQDEIQN